MIYFIQNSEGPIKIGYSKNVKTRFESLQSSNPDTLILLAEVKGNKTMEQELHNKFSHLKIRGEWFKPERELTEHIQFLMNRIEKEKTYNHKETIPLSLHDIMIGVGENIRLARLRRNITTAMLAERANICRKTLRDIECGEPSVSFGKIVMVLFCLGLEDGVSNLGSDDILGRKLQDANISIGCRVKRKKH